MRRTPTGPRVTPGERPLWYADSRYCREACGEPLHRPRPGLEFVVTSARYDVANALLGYPGVRGHASSFGQVTSSPHNEIASAQNDAADDSSSALLAARCSAANVTDSTMATGAYSSLPCHNAVCDCR